MRLRHVLALALLTTALATPANAAAAPVLAGTTVVSGAAMGSLQVRVPRDTSVSLQPTSDYTQGRAATFHGTGRLLALGLVDRWHSQTWLTQSNVCMERGCASSRRFFVGTSFGENGFAQGTARLEAGTYTLVWIADGAPASVTLTLPGLPGRRTLRPAATKTQEWGPAETASLAAPAGDTAVKTYEGDTEIAMPRAGTLFGVSWVASNLMQAEERVCAIPEGSDPMPAVGPCPLGSSGWSGEQAIYCPTCLVTDLVLPNGESWIGTYVWLGMAKGRYVVEGEARYAGRFGAVGLAVAPVPFG